MSLVARQSAVGGWRFWRLGRRPPARDSARAFGGRSVWRSRVWCCLRSAAPSSTKAWPPPARPPRGRRRGLMLGQEERNMGNGVARTCGCRRATQLWTDTALGRDRAQQPRPRLKAQGSPSLRQSGSVRTNRDLSGGLLPLLLYCDSAPFRTRSWKPMPQGWRWGPHRARCGGCVPGARTLPAVGSGR